MKKAGNSDAVGRTSLPAKGLGSDTLESCSCGCSDYIGGEGLRAVRITTPHHVCDIHENSSCDGLTPAYDGTLATIRRRTKECSRFKVQVCPDHEGLQNRLGRSEAG